ncbi:hypothetical protein QYF36_000881 [Acer negundo]|nr:hypothetical protein QYF36_000881 [Acer negundo]
MLLNRPSGVLLNVEVAPLTGNVRASLSINTDRGQSKTMPSNSVLEVSLTGEGKATRVDDAHLEVIPLMDANPKEVRGTLCVSTATGSTTLVRFDCPPLEF